jgi:hypothetical protein
MPEFGTARPGTTMSEAIKEAYASAPADVVILHTIELRHPSFRDDNGNPTGIRVVRDNQNLTARLETGAPLQGGQEVEFIALNFQFTLPPEDDKGSIPEIAVVIDNVGRILMQHLDAAVESEQPIEITYRPYLSTDLSAPHMNPPLTMTLRNIEVTSTRVTARASFADLANRRFPTKTYDLKAFPSLVTR